MAEQSAGMTKENLKQLADVIGVAFLEGEFDKIAPQILESLEALDKISLAGLQDVEPAITFKTTEG